mgnify:CR=1 FL=1
MSRNLIIRNGCIMSGNPAVEICGDLLLEDGKISRIGNIGRESAPCAEIDAGGKYILPGLVDPHTHYIENKQAGYKMLIAAGVTTALDTIVGNGDIIRQYVANNGAGLTCAAFYLLKPDSTVPGTNPSRDELDKAIKASKAEKLYGVKIAGAHYPFTPEANARAIAQAAELGIPLMIHAGSTESTDDMNGMREIVEGACGNPFILAHVNVYCNGKASGNPDADALEAIRMLNDNPRIVSESTLNIYGSIGTRMINDIPESLCMQEMLREAGYDATYQGLLAALEKGAFQASGPVGWEYRILSPSDGVALCRERHGQVTVRSLCRKKSTNVIVASGKRADGSFTVPAFSSDGGIIPANIVLQEGLELVEAGVLTLSEFVQKSAYAGAALMGIDGRKGIIAEGADADLIIVDRSVKKPEYTITNGQVVYHNGEFIPAPNVYLALPDHLPYWLR